MFTAFDYFRSHFFHVSGAISSLFLEKFLLLHCILTPPLFLPFLMAAKHSNLAAFPFPSPSSPVGILISGCVNPDFC